MSNRMRNILEWAGVILFFLFVTFAEGIYDVLFMHG
jgi:hypothetical protein